VSRATQVPGPITISPERSAAIPEATHSLLFTSQPSYTASASMVMWTSLPTTIPPESRLEFQLTPKSWRLMIVSAETLLDASVPVFATLPSFVRYHSRE
jgi:hypothetical protein